MKMLILLYVCVGSIFVAERTEASTTGTIAVFGTYYDESTGKTVKDPEVGTPGKMAKEVFMAIDSTKLNWPRLTEEPSEPVTVKVITSTMPSANGEKSSLRCDLKYKQYYCLFYIVPEDLTSDTVYSRNRRDDSHRVDFKGSMAAKLYEALKVKPNIAGVKSVANLSCATQPDTCSITGALVTKWKFSQN